MRIRGSLPLYRRYPVSFGLLGIAAAISLFAQYSFHRSATRPPFDSTYLTSPLNLPTSTPPFNPQYQQAIRVESGGIRMEITAADRQTFHIVIASSTTPLAAGPPSPFVVETTPYTGTGLMHRQAISSIQIPAGRLTVTADGQITIQDRQGRTLLWHGAPRQTNGSMELAFNHKQGQRFYGGGNAGSGESGGLIHTSGTSAVGNGYTRIPFISSTGGYALLVANDESGIEWADRAGANRAGADRAGTLQWSVPGSFIDLNIMLAPDIYGLLDAYAQLTGRAPVPPLWTLGYLQSRWGYADAADVRDKWYQFRRRHIPVDAFIYDYDWFVDDWAFNPKTFPDPTRDLAEMHRLGIRFVGIRKPRVHGPRLEYARERHWMLVGADLRFDLPAVQDWWWAQHAPLVQTGVDGWWNDEGEAAYDTFFFMNKAESEGWRRVTGKPFWSLSRAFAPGMQRFGAAAWTGDIASTWKALQNQPGTLMNWGLCGMPFCGQDIGGFSGTPSPELYARWMQEGALVPVMRAHGALNLPRWPWSFGDKALDAARKAITLRYRLRPYLYACEQESSRTGAPVMRPLFLEFPDDPITYNMEHEWLLGRNLLAAPVLEPGGRSAVYLPHGVWRDFNTGQTITGPKWVHKTVPLDTIPLYLRGAAPVKDLH